jgi:hypothetical protein
MDEDDDDEDDEDDEQRLVEGIPPNSARNMGSVLQPLQPSWARWSHHS